MCGSVSVDTRGNGLLSQWRPECRWLLSSLAFRTFPSSPRMHRKGNCIETWR